jgi:hypothetical protein
MRYHIGDGVGGFGFAGNVREPVRLQTVNSSARSGEIKTRGRKGRLQSKQGINE